MRWTTFVCLSALTLAGCYPPKDCAQACEHVIACREAGYDDTDLQNTSREACVAACQDDVSLNFCFDDCSAAEIRVRWQCATARTECSDLDHVCDVY
jgi:hypothetical protein